MAYPPGNKNRQCQSPDDFARQVADDKIFYALELKELDMRLE